MFRDMESESGLHLMTCARASRVSKGVWCTASRALALATKTSKSCSPTAWPLCSALLDWCPSLECPGHPHMETDDEADPQEASTCRHRDRPNA